MTMRTDYEKVMRARANVHAAKTLPERFYLVLCYQASAQAFFEEHMERIERMMPPAPADLTRWTI